MPNTYEQQVVKGHAQKIALPPPLPFFFPSPLFIPPSVTFLLASEHDLEITAWNPMHAPGHLSARRTHARAHAALPTPLELKPLHQAAHDTNNQIRRMDIGKKRI